MSQEASGTKRERESGLLKTTQAVTLQTGEALARLPGLLQGLSQTLGRIEAAKRARIAAQTQDEDITLTSEASPPPSPRGRRQ